MLEGDSFAAFHSTSLFSFLFTEKETKVCVFFFFFFFLTSKGYWLRENKKKYIKKKSRLSSDPVKRTLEEKKQGMKVQLTLEVS